MIDKLSELDPVQNLRASCASEHVARAPAGDEITVSAEAQKKAELYLALEAVRSAPDVREYKIAAAEQKLADPAYLERALSHVVERFLEEQNL